MPDTTPPRSMPTPSPDMSVADYRLLQLEHKCDGVSRDVKKLHDALIGWRASDKTEMLLAIERCSTHGKRLDHLEQEFKDHTSDESTAVIRVVNHELERREFAATKDNTARWYGIGGIIAAFLSGLAQYLGLGPK